MNFHPDDLRAAEDARLTETECRIWLRVASDTRTGRSKGTAHYAGKVGLSVECTYAHLSRARRKILALRERERGDYERTPSPEYQQRGAELLDCVANTQFEERTTVDRNGEPGEPVLCCPDSRGRKLLPSAPVVSTTDAAKICEAGDRRRGRL